ncbi:hypothetical protein RBU60_03285 [Mesonia sp. MT50]|uniref:Uncharacterized protein n=1 Tax=Mesonia profundi TaxID=3070998 RepID=A0ABU1A1K4_9FLAO|nr:hypothetical protein [Mesonia profundi]MDQ7916586.1 hypothetical protein [Mesonia profundi]
MKTLKKTTYLILLALLSMMTSCSSDDDLAENPQDPGPSQGTTAPFDLGEIYQKDLTLPTQLNQSTDENAMGLVSKYEEVIGFQDDSDIAQVPPGAVLSHDPVQAGNGRSTANEDYDYDVYTYTVGGTTLIYQFSVQNGEEVFELFQDIDGDELDMMLLYEVRQSMDGATGTASFYFFGAAITWTWQVNADESILMTMQIPNGINGGILYEAMLYPDNSGYLSFYVGNDLNLEYHWSGDGSGTWVNHTNNESGSWN